MGYTYLKTLFCHSILEDGFEKDIEFAEIVKKEDSLFLRHFKHTCSKEGNGRPSTLIKDTLYPINNSNVLLSLQEENVIQNEVYRYIERYNADKIDLVQEVSNNVYSITYRTKLGVLV